MSEQARAEAEALVRPFVIGCALVALLLVAIGAGIAVVNAGNDRPEGAGERWLTALSDTTRKGLRADAIERVEALGSLAIGTPLLPEGDTDGRAAFDDLEVGRGREVAGTVRVPYRLHQRDTGGGDAESRRAGVIVLVEASDGWHVVGLEAAGSRERVPSDGGDPPSRAPLGAWLGFAAAGVIVTAVCGALVRWAGR